MNLDRRRLHETVAFRLGERLKQGGSLHYISLAFSKLYYKYQE